MKHRSDQPNNLLNDVLWNFATEKFNSLDSFSKALIAYNKEINSENDLDIHRVFNSSREIEVQFMYWGEDEDGDEDQIEEDFTVQTDNAQGFTVNEFLFKVHNRICEQMTEEDATFFEGLIPGNEGSEKPFFFLNQGS